MLVFEINDEVGIVPTIDHRMLRGIAATRSQLALRCAPSLLDLAHRKPAGGQIHRRFLLHAMDQQAVAMLRLGGMSRRCHGKTSGGDQHGDDRQSIRELDHGSPLQTRLYAASF